MERAAAKDDAGGARRPEATTGVAGGAKRAGRASSSRDRPVGERLMFSREF